MTCEEKKARNLSYSSSFVVKPHKIKKTHHWIATKLENSTYKQMPKGYDKPPRRKTLDQVCTNTLGALKDAA